MVQHYKIKFAFIALFLFAISFAQIMNPVKWSQSVKQIDDTTFDVTFSAKIDDGWHLYSTKHKDGGIGIPTSITWEENAYIKPIGNVKELGEIIDFFSKEIDEQQVYYANKVDFVQRIKASNTTTAKAEVMFQLCDDAACLPPDYKTFEFKLNPVSKNEVSSKKEKNKEDKQTEAEVKIDKKQDEISESVTEPIFADNDLESTDSMNILSVDSTQVVAALDSSKSSKIKDKTDASITESISKKRSFWEIFIFGLLGGFAALLMPCIFPMIPLTVSLFTKQSKSKGSGIGKAIIYGVSILVIYVALGLIITGIYGAGALNAIATNPWVNIGFFVLFIVFAISFFGAFEITLPSKWVNKADKGADRGGLIGIFFMALTLVLVSFSCTGPIIGLLLVDSASSGALLGPAIGMFGFALALALPFTLFAIFPSWLNSLPSSGGWLNTVKVSLGFIELAFAFKFLSNADLVWQAHLLEREIFLAIWIGIFFVMGLYLLNMFRMKHDSEYKTINTPRLIFAMFTFVFVFYILPGLWGAPLKILSGLTPPKNYAESPNGISGGAVLTTNSQLPQNAHYGPHQIPVFHDMDDAIVYSEKTGKPIMVDFTGDSCANCRRVEDNVWSDPRVVNKLTNDVVLVSLYVDRRVDLPEEERVYSEEKGRNLRTIGDKWSAYQIKNFQSNAQPLYIIVDKDLNRYNSPIGTELDVDTYLNWMDEGISNFESKSIK